MTATGHFLRALRLAGAAVHHRVTGGEIESPEDYFSMLSEPESTPEAWIDAARPLEQVIMTGGGPRLHRGGQVEKEKTAKHPPAPPADEAARPSAAVLKRRIKKLRREIANLERKSAKKTGQNRT